VGIPLVARRALNDVCGVPKVNNSKECIFMQIFPDRISKILPITIHDLDPSPPFLALVEKRVYSGVPSPAFPEQH